MLVSLHFFFPSSLFDEFQHLFGKYYVGQQFLATRHTILLPNPMQPILQLQMHI